MYGKIKSAISGGPTPMKAAGFALSVFLLSAQLILLPGARAQAEMSPGPILSGEMLSASLRQGLGLEKDPLVSSDYRNWRLDKVLEDLARQAGLEIIVLVAEPSCKPLNKAGPGEEEDPLILLNAECSKPYNPFIHSYSFSEFNGIPVSSALSLLINRHSLKVRKISKTLLIATAEKMEHLFNPFTSVRAYQVDPDWSQNTGYRLNSLPSLIQATTNKNGLPAPFVFLENTLLIGIGNETALSLVDKKVTELTELSNLLKKYQVEFEARLVEVDPIARQELGLCKNYTQEENNKHNQYPFNSPLFDHCLNPPPLILFFSNSDFQPEFLKGLEFQLREKRVRVIDSRKFFARHGSLANIDYSKFFASFQQESQAQNSCNTATYLIKELNVTPYIDVKKNQITLKIKPEVQSPTNQCHTLPGYPSLTPLTNHAIVSSMIWKTETWFKQGLSVNTRNFETILRITSEDSIIISGFGADKVSDKSSEAPWFSNLPLIGKAFSGPDGNPALYEVIIILTARIVEAR